MKEIKIRSIKKGEDVNTYRTTIKKEYQEYFDSMDSITDTYALNNEEGILYIGTNDEISKLALNRKSKRMGLWLTESLYNDLQILQQVYPELTINELIYKIALEHNNFIKSEPIWKKINEINKLKKGSKSIFLKNQE